MFFWISLCLALLAALAGAHALRRQMAAGLNATALSDRVPWGLYIQGFFTLGSLAGGLLLLAGLSRLATNVMPAAAPALAMGCLVGGGLLLAADLGKPLRSPLLILGKNPGSPMTWDFYLFCLNAILVMAGVVYSARNLTPGLPWAICSIIASGAFLLTHALLLAGNGEGKPFLALEVLIRAACGGAGLLSCLAISSAAPKLFLGLSLLAALTHCASRLALKHPEDSPPLSRLSWALCADLAVAGAALLSLYTPAVFMIRPAALGAIALLVWEKRRMMLELQRENRLPAPYAQWQARISYTPSHMETRVCIGGIGLAIATAQIAWRISG
ncbi:MAG: polysulfide reductase NrfD [Deltaproteobacteria bacterium]|jgi:hypothetical protein|nr:polysulfide reductase NrfD [Deltaproteobacteria bacterium]